MQIQSSLAFTGAVFCGLCDYQHQLNVEFQVVDPGICVHLNQGECAEDAAAWQLEPEQVREAGLVPCVVKGRVRLQSVRCLFAPLLSKDQCL